MIREIDSNEMQAISGGIDDLSYAIQILETGGKLPEWLSNNREVMSAIKAFAAAQSGSALGTDLDSELVGVAGDPAEMTIDQG